MNKLSRSPFPHRQNAIPPLFLKRGGQGERLSIESLKMPPPCLRASLLKRGSAWLRELKHSRKPKRRVVIRKKEKESNNDFRNRRRAVNLLSKGCSITQLYYQSQGGEARRPLKPLWLQNLSFIQNKIAVIA